MISSLYVGIALGVVGAVVWIILVARRRGINGWLIGWLAAVLFSILFMIKLRCKIGAYGCGFMSFSGGFTWHLIAGLVVFFGLWAVTAAIVNLTCDGGWLFSMDHIGRAMAPLLGLSIAVIWEILPVSIIHPPFVDGSCPDLPIICHDIPVWGYGGLFYWTAPFFLWAAIGILWDVGRLCSRGTVPQCR